MKRFATMLFLAGCLLSPVGATDAYGSEGAPPTVSVEGVATVSISQTASQAEANAAYRQGLTAAVVDGLEKASFLAATTDATIGPIQQIIERGGSIECDLPAEEGPLRVFEPYDGVRPDFGSVPIGPAGEVFSAAPAAAAPKAAPTNEKKRKKKSKARKAAEAIRCTLSTQIVLSYLLTMTAQSSPAGT